MIFGDAVKIVKFPRPVNAEPHQKSVLLQKSRPFLSEKRAVGLEIVFDALIGFRVFLLEVDDFAEKV